MFLVCGGGQEQPHQKRNIISSAPCSRWPGTSIFCGCQQQKTTTTGARAGIVVTTTTLFVWKCGVSGWHFENLILKYLFGWHFSKTRNHTERHASRGCRRPGWCTTSDIDHPTCCNYESLHVSREIFLEFRASSAILGTEEGRPSTTTTTVRHVLVWELAWLVSYLMDFSREEITRTVGKKNWCWEMLNENEMAWNAETRWWQRRRVLNRGGTFLGNVNLKLPIYFQLISSMIWFWFQLRKAPTYNTDL